MPPAHVTMLASRLISIYGRDAVGMAAWAELQCELRGTPEELALYRAVRPRVVEILAGAGR